MVRRTCYQNRMKREWEGDVILKEKRRVIMSKMGHLKKKKKTKGVILQISRVFGYTRQACPPKKPRKPQDPTAR